MNFKWIGTQVGCYNDNPLVQKDSLEFYQSFSYNGQEFRAGEFAVFKENNSTTICRLLCLFESHVGACKYNGLVRIYTWSRNLKRKLNALKIKFDVENEIVEESDDAILSLTNIEKKCKVIFSTLEEDRCIIKKFKLDPDLNFVCRYKIQSGQLIPYFSDDSLDSNSDYSVDSQFDDQLEIVATSENSESSDMVGVTILNEKSSFTKTTPNKTYKRKANHTGTVINLDSEGSDGEEAYIKKIRSPLKNLKLTPKSGSAKKLNRAFSSPLNRNLSVKRVLNDSFDDHPEYSIVETNQDPKQLKLKLKLKVNVTTLDDKIVYNNSPIQISDIQKINNHVLFSPNAKDELCDSPRQLQPLKQTQSPYTPAQISSTRRRSSRSVQRQSYAEYFSPTHETPKRRVRRGSTDSLRSVQSPIKKINDCKIILNKIEEEEDNGKKSLKKNEELVATTPRSKRSVCLPERYRNDSINETPTKPEKVTRSVGRPKKSNSPVIQEISKQSGDSDKKNNSTGKSSRLTRSVGRPKKYSNSPSPKRNVGRPSKSIETNTSDSEDETKIKKSKTPYSTTKTKDDIRKSVLKNSCKKLLYAESDEEDAKPRTPKKDTPTARARMIREGIITPSVQSRNKAVIKDNTPLSKARTQLHVSYVPQSLPCREKEFANIINFLEGKLLDGCGGCMYVSGVPGTGKTATVTEVIRNLQNSVESGDLPSFTYLNVNGMRLSEPRQSYVEIVKQLMGKTVHWEQAQTMLENRFVKSRKKSTPIILVIDELDILCTKRQDVVYNLLDWPTKANAQLIVITIANTMDLPERLLMGRVTSRLGLTRLTFQAYTHKQLQEIVSKRLAGISAFNPDAIQLVARKVASVSGDARRALDICRRAVEIAEVEGKHALVSMSHVNQALNAMFTQPKVQAIMRCSRLEKLLLQAVVSEVERTGVEETNFASVLTMLIQLAALDGFQMVSNTIVMGAVSKLGACRLLLTDQKHSNIYQKIILNVSGDDVYYALTKTDL